MPRQSHRTRSRSELELNESTERPRRGNSLTETAASLAQRLDEEVRAEAISSEKEPKTTMALRAGVLRRAVSSAKPFAGSTAEAMATRRGKDHDRQSSAPASTTDA